MATNNIRDLIQTLANTGDIAYGIPARVTAVDKTANTCDVDPLDDSGEYLDVSLMATTGKGFVLFPKVGSIVLIQKLDKDNAYVSQFGEIESYQWENETDSVKMLLADLAAQVKALSDATAIMTVTTPQGPSTNVINKISFDNVSQAVDTIADRIDTFFEK